MTHLPRVCAIERETGKHGWSSWDTVETVNPAGETLFEFQRRCSWCGLVDVARGAIVETREPYRYARVLKGHEEPSD